MTANKKQPIRTRYSSDREEHLIPLDNPATGEVIGWLQGGGAAEVDRAISSAKEAQKSWARRTPRERGKYLQRAAALVREHADEIATLESLEMGKPVSQARQFDLETCIGVLEFFGGAVEASPSQVRDQGFALDITLLEPHGIVGAIIPFNWPPIHTAGKIAPALAVGNAIVIKPPEQAPRTVLRIAELIASALPDDVIHVVPGFGSAGAALSGHPGIDKISFTGSPVTGARVMKSAADNHTPTLMELGGKNALIVFDDADVDAAARAVLEGGWFNQGEACTAVSRVLVHRSHHDELVSLVSPAIERLVVGDGADDATHVGPIATPAQREKVHEYLRIAEDEGAVVAARAALPTDPRLANGYYVQPTLLTEVTPEMRVAKEEIFGPVVTVIPFDTEEEAVRIANDTDFGLTGVIFTRDSERGMRVARALHVGMVWINNYNRMVVGMPFGGVKASGYGREHSLETLAQYGYTKNIRIPSGLSPAPAWQAVSEVFD